MDPSLPTPPIPHHRIKALMFIGIILSLLLILLGLSSLFKSFPPSKSTLPKELASKFKLTPTETVEKFKSEEEFKKYITDTMSSGSNYFGSAPISMGLSDTTFSGLSSPLALKIGESAASRISSTNVQVIGLDEPDILKSNGKQLFYSDTFSSTWPSGGTINRELYYPDQQADIETKVIDVFPPDKLGVLSKITESGNLLLYKDILVVLSSDNRSLNGYSIKDPANPQSKWQIKLASGQNIIAARLKSDKIYIVSSTTPSFSDPCPYPVLTIGDTPLKINCTDVYHPVSPVPSSTLFTITSLDISTGTVRASTAFVASSESSVIYVSPEHLYITYSYDADMTSVLFDFFSTTASDLVTSSFTDRLKELSSYTISSPAKMIELNNLIQGYQASLSPSDKIRVQNEMQNRLDTYLKDHRRQLQFTGIAKFDLSSLRLTDIGRVPGHPLNQFSLDEYNTKLRVAVTLDPTWLGGFGFSSTQSVSDVYVLNSNLSESGSVQGLGETEKIYSVRFVEDRGYVVTFRQIDPFYVLDLSNPSSPKKTGELKIPGYSSYLHPVGEHKVLGVGKEGSQVKVSLFDVSDPTAPKELSKYTLAEYWSEALSTHHAFLNDAKYQNFFIPGSQAGYVISYANDTLSLRSTVPAANIRRAAYISNYLYLVSTSQIVVINQQTGNTIKEFAY